MSNADTLKAIKANIESILTADDFKVEDLSDDADADLIPLAVIIFTGEDFGAAFGERPLYNEAGYNVVIGFKDNQELAQARDRAADYVQKIRAGLTVSALNTGLLAASKLVSFVRHEGYSYNYNRPASEINYKIKVRYRET